MSAFRDEWPLPTQSENRVREHSLQEDEGLNFSSQEAETFLGHSGGNVQEVDTCPEKSFGEAASHTWRSVPQAKRVHPGSMKRRPRQHLREHQYIRDQQSLGGCEGHKGRARELP